MLLTPQDTLTHDFAAFVNAWMELAEISRQQKLLQYQENHVDAQGPTSRAVSAGTVSSHTV